MRRSLCAALAGFGFVVLGLTVVGCGRQTVGDQPGDRYNKAISQKQQSVLEAHKNRDED